MDSFESRWEASLGLVLCHEEPWKPFAKVNFMIRAVLPEGNTIVVAHIRERKAPGEETRQPLSPESRCGTQSLA